MLYTYQTGKQQTNARIYGRHIEKSLPIRTTASKRPEKKICLILISSSFVDASFCYSIVFYGAPSLNAGSSSKRNKKA